MEKENQEEKRQVPEIKIEENQVVLPTMKVPLILNGKEVLIEMRKSTSGQRRDIFKTHLQTSISGQQIKGEVYDLVGIQIAMLSKVIIDAPFDFTEKGLGKLPEEVVDYLYEEYEDWGKKKQKSGDWFGTLLKDIIQMIKN